MALRPIYYDTETTGIRSDKDRIIELAAYDPLRDRSFVQLIHPGCPIPPEATAIHHITDDMVASAPSFGKVAEEFVAFCEGDVVLVAHNGDAFDKPFLGHEFRRHNVPMPAWRTLDTLKWSRRYRPDLPRHSLQFLREVYQVPVNQAHRALDDVLVLHNVFSQMIDDLPWETICAMLEVKRALSTMPFGKHQGTALAKLPPSYVQWLASSGALDKDENADLKSAFQQLKLL